MRWTKKGLIYAPSGHRWWAKGYATLPTAEVINSSVIRLYFASLDENQFGRIGYIDVDAEQPERILYETREPILEIGDLGAFDDSGVNPSCIVNHDGKKYLYYIGWQRCERVPYMLFSGLAIGGSHNEPLVKFSKVPVLDRTTEEPYSRSAPFVMKDGTLWKVWYWSCTHWVKENNRIHYYNIIKYCESDDGINWNRKSEVCISPDGIQDYSVGRPWVLKDKDLYRMWYSIRSNAEISYRIGYAESSDGIVWARKDNEAGISTSENKWDSEMICYPCIVDVNGNRLMFYNGNRHGYTGFGYAVLET